ncbi:MAG: hydantoinase/oxoprolinase family protein, partial [Gaiellales bacterium]
DGTVVVELDAGAAAAAIDQLIEQGVDAVAVCLLHAYRNGAHERRLGELVRERDPSLSVSLSSEVDPVFREYERTVVTYFDAYLRPVVGGYLEDLRARLAETGITCALQVMQSRGGIAAAEYATRRPVTLLLSGPAAGVVGATGAGRRCGVDDVVTLDVGGTSADVALVEAGRPVATTEGGVDGFPLRVPLVDVSTIGAGGGSIAWLDRAGGLRVGPRSAGAHPGPICYRRGGSEPTVTDAFHVLGYLDPRGLADGTLPLDARAARDAYADLGRALGLGAEQAAGGVVQVAAMRLVDQLRLATVRRGHDPRRFSLVALGGAGPIFAALVAAELGISRVLIPPAPGTLSAQGLLDAPVEHDRAETLAIRVDDAEPAELESAFHRLAAQVGRLMDDEGAPRADTVTRRFADARYVGQGSTVEVQLGARIDRQALGALADAFHERHRRVYGHSQPGNPVELLNARVVQSWQPRQAGFTPAAGEGHSSAPSRVAWFAGQALDTPVVDRAGLRGERSGPLIVHQPDTTVLVAPGQRLAPGPAGNLVLSVP